MEVHGGPPPDRRRQGIRRGIPGVLELDGADGGGQLLRSALSLSMLAGRPFDLENVRGGRDDPGLRPQHLAAVELAADVCGATVEGAAIGSEEVRFDPGDPRPGEYTVDVETAGSVTLLCETLLPLAARLDGPLRAELSGGTDVAWSPPLDYLDRVKLPLLRAHGWPAVLVARRRGFYPAGGGEVMLTLAPGAPHRFDLDQRGGRTRASVYAIASEDLHEAEVADRLASDATEGLRGGDWTVGSWAATYAETASTGAALALALGFDRGRAGVGVLGERGVPAEQIASRAVRCVAAFERTDAAVDPYLADQLLVPLAVAGGSIRVPRVTDHVETSVRLLRAFDVDLRVDDRVVSVPSGGTLSAAE